MTSPKPLTRLLRASRGMAFRTFYALPPRVRRRLVRFGVGTYTVGAVVLATDTTGTGTLLLMVRQHPGKGWSLPAGLLQRDETPPVGAARELAEETGVRVGPEDLTPAIPNAIVHTRGRWIDLVFTTSAATGQPLRPDGGEILDVAWHAVDDLPPVTPSTARLLGVYGMGPLAEYPEALSD